MTESASDRPAAVMSERFPVWNFLRGFRIAVSISHILLGTAAILVLAVGQRGIDMLPYAPLNAQAQWPWQEQLLPGGGSQEAWATNFGRSSLFRLLIPFSSVAKAGVELLGSGNTLTSAAYYWTHLLWAFAVWGYFGGAISRMSAVSFATDRSIGMKTAMRYAARRFLSFFSAPLLPIGGLLFLWLVLLVGGFVGRIPTVGPFLVAIFWIIGLAIGLVAALIAIGLFAGWPLMSPTIATEDSDAFDGFSRSFSYVFSRPLQGIGFGFVAVFYGIVCVAIVTLLVSLIIHLTEWGISAGMGTNEVAVLTSAPVSDAVADSENYRAALNSIPAGAVTVTTFWRNTLTVLVQGFAVSLFWTLATISYFLLRHSDDATSLDEVFLTEADEPDDLLPLVGVAASEQPAIERPLDVESAPSTDGENTSD